MNKITEILNFWFEGLDDTKPLDKNSPAVQKWFKKDSQFDRSIQDRFEDDLKKASQSECKSWEDAVKGRLALILLFDQFPRNMYRETPKMFACDAVALDLTLRTIHEKMDTQLQLVERLFLYMPLQHAEDIQIQKMSLKHFGNLVAQSKEKCPFNTPYYEFTFHYAQRHHDVIQQFGHFPHRNRILNRTSTNEEIEFLKKPGTSF